VLWQLHNTLGTADAFWVQLRSRLVLLADFLHMRGAESAVVHFFGARQATSGPLKHATDGLLLSVVLESSLWRLCGLAIGQASLDIGYWVAD
jgi:hypothetical protein